MTKVLEGKTALVTGASRGIGRSIAQRLAASGALVAINYAANENAARETLKLIEDAGGKGFILHAALGTPEAAKKLAATLDAELTKRTGNPGLDILVNNVGGATYASIETATPEIYNKTFEDNVGSTFFVTQAVLPRLRQGGRVINLSSAGARLALEPLIVYSMSKAAVNVFTRALAKELGPRGITVNAVAPGFVATDAAAADIANADGVAYMKANTALGRPYAEPEEISEVVHGLATPAMGWVTGQLIEASGGFRM
jgi:NAD(P)-dependent dehydrogenase (short-subunit alcohol dehydrogenase family)